MVGHSQTTMRRYCLHLSEQEMADLVWAANQGAEQVFGYTNPMVDWGMTDEEFEAWGERLNAAIALLEQAAKDGGLLP